MDEPLTIKVKTPTDRYQEKVDKANADPTIPYPFPLASFPEPIQNVIHEVAESIGVDYSMVGLSVLVTAAGAVGNGAVLRVSNSYKEPAILWGAIVAGSGAGKSPVISFVTKPMKDVHRELVILNDERKKSHNLAFCDFKAGCDIRKAELKKVGGDTSKLKTATPIEPPKLRIEGAIVTDATQEAVCGLLEGSPKGLTSIHDELAGFFANQDKHSGADGSDEAFFNTAFQGGEHCVSRAGNGSRMIQKASVSILGGIPPTTLQQRLSDSAKLSGFVGRFLFCSPEKREWKRGIVEIPARIIERWDSVIKNLRSIPVTFADTAGQLRTNPDDLTGLKQNPSTVVDLSEEAVDVFEDFKEQLNGVWIKSQGFAESYLSKFRTHVLRIALVLNLMESASNQDNRGRVSEECMKSAVELCWFFIREIELIEYRAAEAKGTPEPTIEDKCEAVERWLIKSDRRGRITHREIQRSLTKSAGVNGSEELERVMARMEQDGVVDFDSFKNKTGLTVKAYQFPSLKNK